MEDIFRLSNQFYDYTVVVGKKVGNHKTRMIEWVAKREVLSKVENKSKVTAEKQSVRKEQRKIGIVHWAERYSREDINNNNKIYDKKQNEPRRSKWVNERYWSLVPILTPINVNLWKGWHTYSYTERAGYKKKIITYIRWNDTSQVSVRALVVFDFEVVDFFFLRLLEK